MQHCQKAKVKINNNETYLYKTLVWLMCPYMMNIGLSEYVHMIMLLRLELILLGDSLSFWF